MPATVPGHRSPCPAQQPDRNTELLLVMHLGLCKDPNSHLALGLVLGAAGQGEKGNVVREMQLTIWQDLASAALGFELGAHGGFREVWGGAPDLRSVSVYSHRPMKGTCLLSVQTNHLSTGDTGADRLCLWGCPGYCGAASSMPGPSHQESSGSKHQQHQVEEQEFPNHMAGKGWSRAGTQVSCLPGHRGADPGCHLPHGKQPALARCPPR